MSGTKLTPAVAASGAPVNNIDASPGAGQSISHGGQQYTTIKEGLGYILVPHGTPTSTDPKMSKEDSQKQQVFYNPIQQFNRDLSVLAIKAFGEGFVKWRTQRHEEGLKRKRKQPGKKTKKLKPDTADTDATLQALAEGEGTTSRKRKLDDATEEGPGGNVETAESVAKKAKLTNGDNSEFRHLGIIPPATETNGPDVRDPPQPDEHNTSANITGLDYRPGFKILDALSATGLRALRYANEIPFVTSVTANDLSAMATESIALNVKHNKLDEKVHAHHGNAVGYMYEQFGKKGYDVIDLDPYGTAAPFLDSAVQAISDEGLLCVTCTDSAIFASHGYLEKTYSQYGGLPLIGDACHEGGIRLILHAVASSAARYGMAIEPLLSLSIDYYVRVFVRVRKSANDVKFLAGKTMIVYNCYSGCKSWATQYLARHKVVESRKGNPFYKHSFSQGPSTNEHCEHCGTNRQLAGPMYGGPIHNVDFIKRVLAQVAAADTETYHTRDRIEGMLHTALEEITYGPQAIKVSAKVETKQLDPIIPKADPAEREYHPFFINPSGLAKVLHCQAPPAAALRGALRHAGYRVTMSHCKPGSIRTDAPWKVIWHIMLEWIRQEAPLRNKPSKGSPGYHILSQSSHHKMDDANTRGGAVVATEPDSEEGPADKPERMQVDVGSKTEVQTGAKPSFMDVNFPVVFDELLGKDTDRGKYVRYQVAPRENWGPMARAK
ncbi:S-adenosyl-L-methionine-dependent methyltransferase [Lophiotrema nucula]|uniref:tRNA (guanine(26)-N(2))-dimethyltransferase n=1 Tax=Lophiotrema nucula TaxID=690887 RepID=A0A6A5YXW8_9PLEO|nr:S-adenosyl-L-methionine-dependent methyltransferase [Lophiotrema nucula]